MRRFLAAVVAVSLLVYGLEPEVLGQRGSSSSRSSSSGSSSSFGRSSSGSSSSSSGRSYGSGSSSSSSGRSYGSSSSSSSSSSRQPSSSSSTTSGGTSGRSYGSGSTSSSSKQPATSGSSSSSSSKPTTSGGTSGRSYGSGGSAPSTTPPAAGGTSGRSYGSSSTGAGASGAGVRSNSKIDQAGTDARKKQESQAAYRQATAPASTPASTYRDPKTGTEKKLDSNSESVKTIRRTVTHERYVTRETRIHDFYGPRYVGMTPVYYSDPFGPFFWLWLMDRSLDDRAHWAYHHRHQMDDARYRDMVAKDAQLEARIRQLEQQGVKRDQNYVPAAMADNPDLMYNDDFVRASYNPVPAPAPAQTSSSSSSGVSGWTVLLWIVVIGGVVFVIWFIFVRKA